MPRQALIAAVPWPVFVGENGGRQAITAGVVFASQTAPAPFTPAAGAVAVVGLAPATVGAGVAMVGEGRSTARQGLIAAGPWPVLIAESAARQAIAGAVLACETGFSPVAVAIQERPPATGAAAVLAPGAAAARLTGWPPAIFGLAVTGASASASFAFAGTGPNPLIDEDLAVDGASDLAVGGALALAVQAGADFAGAGAAMAVGVTGISAALAA